jgi:hypothetical protein
MQPIKAAAGSRRHIIDGGRSSMSKEELLEALTG